MVSEAMDSEISWERVFSMLFPLKVPQNSGANWQIATPISTWYQSSNAWSTSVTRLASCHIPHPHLDMLIAFSTKDQHHRWAEGNLGNVNHQSCSKSIFRWPFDPLNSYLGQEKKWMTEVPKNTSIELLQLSGSIPTSIRQSQAQASTHAASAWTILRAHWLEFGWRLTQEARKHMCQLCFVQLLDKATQPRSTCARLRGAMMPPSSDLWDATSPTDITNWHQNANFAGVTQRCWIESRSCCRSSSHRQGLSRTSGAT